MKLEISDVTNLGFGVGKIDGMVVFVSEAVVGDLVECRIIKLASSYAVGKLERIIRPSEQRCTPRCENKLCHACPYKNTSYSYELKAKENLVRSEMKKAGLEINVMPTVPSPNVNYYRNKAQYPISKGKNGEYTIGFFAPKTHRVIPAHDCPLAKRGFSAILETLIDLFKKTNLSVYDEESGRGLLRHVYLRANDDASEVLLTLVINGKELPGEDIFAKVLKEKHPELAGFLLNFNEKNTNVILGKEYRTVFGKSAIIDTLAGVRLEISAPSFYQINHGTTELIYSKARELARLEKSDTLLDLYCGLGSIGLSMANAAGELIGIEIVPDAVRCATLNAKRNGIENAHFYASDAKDTKKILEGAEMALGRKIMPDVIILDPPRAGADESLVEFISSLSPKRIVYISCNPATLARDLKRFFPLGYSADTVYPYDMFPMTGHVESVVCLKRQIQQ